MKQHTVDDYLPDPIRLQIEQNYYEKINEQARVENFLQSPDFLRDPMNHVALHTDHGVVHVRDVAQQIIQVLDVINGVLIPVRHRARLDFFMKGYGVMVAYLHDIGMVDFSAYGRAMHPEFATQMVFTPEFDDMLSVIWNENAGNLAWRLLNLSDSGLLIQDPRIVLREMLSMSNCHSKSKVPIQVLNDPHTLRKVMQESLGTDLKVLYAKYQSGKLKKALNKAQQAQADSTQLDQIAQTLRDAESRLEQMLQDENHSAQQRVALSRYYTNFEQESFQWLTSEHEQVRELVADVIDTLRALRCADALRQRGTVLKTSGNYEIFVDQKSANAIYALRKGNNQLFLLETANPLSSGEANISGSELTRDGDLRISFYRGAFANRDVVLRGAYNAAVVINDIQSDVIGSFHTGLGQTDSNGQRGKHSVKPYTDILIYLEGVDDNLEFADLVEDELLKLNAGLQDHIKVVPSLQNTTIEERTRYFEGETISPAQKDELLNKMHDAGQKITHINHAKAFKHVRMITVKANELLIKAGTPATFVYIPMGPGLKIIPMGGYQPFSVQAWMPLGNTGVIRGAIRNADVVTDQDVTLLMIPKESYLRRWYQPYSLEEFMQEQGLLAPQPEIEQ